MVTPTGGGTRAHRIDGPQLVGTFYDFYSYLEPFRHNHQLRSSAPPQSIPALVAGTAFHEFTSGEAN